MPADRHLSSGYHVKVTLRRVPHYSLDVSQIEASDLGAVSKIISPVDLDFIFQL